MLKKNTQDCTGFNWSDQFRKAGFIVLVLVQGIMMMSGSCRAKNTSVNQETKNVSPEPEQKDSAPAPPAPKENDEALDTPPLEVLKPETSNKDTSVYSMVVAFFSPGDGIDIKTASEFDAYLKGYTSVTFNKVGWGREGETDFCIRLDMLTGSELPEFKKGAEEILSKSQKVQFQYNAPCKHYRKR